MVHCTFPLALKVLNFSSCVCWSCEFPFLWFASTQHLWLAFLLFTFFIFLFCYLLGRAQGLTSPRLGLYHWPTLPDLPDDFYVLFSWWYLLGYILIIWGLYFANDVLKNSEDFNFSDGKSAYISMCMCIYLYKNHICRMNLFFILKSYIVCSEITVVLFSPVDFYGLSNVPVSFIFESITLSTTWNAMSVIIQVSLLVSVIALCFLLLWRWSVTNSKVLILLLSTC